MFESGAILQYLARKSGRFGGTDARAQAVYQALTAAGIAPDRLQQHGAGAATMVAGNQTPQGRIENRRVEIDFRPEPAAAP